MCIRDRIVTEIKLKQNVSQQLRRQKYFIIWDLFQRPHMWNKLFCLLHSRKHGVTWLNSRRWLVACGWLMYTLLIPYVVTKIANKFGGGLLMRSVHPRERLRIDLILTVKMETRHPVRGPFGLEFSASVIIAELWRPEVARRGNFFSNFCVFWKNDPLW